MERIISIRGLEVMACVGVPDLERATPQRLLIDLRFAANNQLVKLNDDLAYTVDYYEVSLRIAEVAADHPRKLIETLADELRDRLLLEFSLRWIEVTVRKFILPNAKWVGVTVRGDH